VDWNEAVRSLLGRIRCRCRWLIRRKIRRWGRWLIRRKIGRQIRRLDDRRRFRRRSRWFDDRWRLDRRLNDRWRFNGWFDRWFNDRWWLNWRRSRRFDHWRWFSRRWSRRLDDRWWINRRWCWRLDNWGWINRRWRRWWRWWIIVIAITIMLRTAAVPFVILSIVPVMPPGRKLVEFFILMLLLTFLPGFFKDIMNDLFNRSPHFLSSIFILFLTVFMTWAGESWSGPEQGGCCGDPEDGEEKFCLHTVLQKKRRFPQGNRRLVSSLSPLPLGSRPSPVPG
jgi:hypothetical protein